MSFKRHDTFKSYLSTIFIYPFMLKEGIYAALKTRKTISFARASVQYKQNVLGFSKEIGKEEGTKCEERT